jgi:PKHD-type hydroxylase
MLLHLKHLLNADELQRLRGWLGDGAPWVEGAASAGAQAVARKHNRQLAQDSEACREARAIVLGALQRDPLFFSAALPRRIFNPLFNAYGAPGEHYGAHIDNAVMHSRSSGEWVRSDLSCTVFLSDPDSYDGGELVVHHSMGQQRVKFAAGDAVLYPGTSLHEVTPVTRGERLASFFWIESMVRSDEQRRVLFDLDMNLLRLRARDGESDESTGLSGVYHNLLRMWAQP